MRTSTLKWNVTHLDGEISDLLSDKWAELPTQASFFSKLRIISRIYRQVSKRKAREMRKLELDTKVKLEIATAKLHEDAYNIVKQGEVSQLYDTLGGIKTHKVRGPPFA